MRMLLLVAMLALLAPAAARAETYPPYTGLLRDFVDESGLVDYAGLKASRARLDAIVRGIGEMNPAGYESLGDSAKLAFWINTYNVLTLKLIVDHYPIQPLAGREKYPANSIQQIQGAWTGVRFTVMGKERTLDEIENQVIRADFKEPRVHFALVCAALSCPPLRREEYLGPILGQQLDDQARRFFSKPANLKIDRGKNEVYASQILDWFAEDFAPGAVEAHGQAAGKRAAVINAASPYVDAGIRGYLQAAQFRLQYVAYDWTLNEETK
jgi:hypothetical protein